MNRIFIVVFLSSLVFLSALAKEGRVVEEDGVRKVFDSRGQLLAEFQSKDGLEISKYYYSSGELEQERKKNSRTGQETIATYYKNGKVKEKGVFTLNKNGKKGGTKKKYDEEGVLESGQTWEDGVVIATEYFRDKTLRLQDIQGRLRAEMIYKKGKWKGRGGVITRRYDKEGKLIYETPLDDAQRY
jgi:antitoxin component YwqK of YwqJK toxin-antitoxin module